MRWRKKGLIYVPDGTSSWAKHSALTPSPFLVSDDVIRVYSGFRDDAGVSRIGYVDLAANDPSKVLAVSKEPVLDVGIPGTFDDNGVILGDIVQNDGAMNMFYVGFQLVEKVKFLAYTGLAVSRDGGDSFARVKKSPVLDRSEEGLYIRAIHSVMVEDGVWRVWYASGSEWRIISDRPYPSYHIRYIESRDGSTFTEQGIVCITCQDDEYRVGRPRVYKQSGLYRMFYTRGALSGGYIAGYAESSDGVVWQRKDETLGIHASDSGWDSQMFCYPSLMTYKGRTYMFYNGNDYGRTGFGYAVLEEW